jgi:predicted DNA-binding ribbon-helix-helix protein
MIKGSLIRKRSVALRGRKTSLSIEEPFWEELKGIAQRRDISLATLIEGIDEQRDQSNLSSAIRVFVLRYYAGTRSSPTRE